jgi:acyl carrier protein
MEEAIEALERVISAAPGGQIVISTGDLNSRLRVWLGGAQLEDSGKPGSGEMPLHSRPALDTDYVAPGNELENKIAGIWQKVLGLDSVGRYDNFFELGGNSLTALKVASRLNRQLGIKLPLVLLFEGPTVSALAKLIAGTQHDKTTLDESEGRGLRRRQMQTSFITAS